jgi:effector-binding domain-containing protein
MQITETLPVNFLYQREETTITDLEKFLPYGQQLFSESVRCQFPITGPVHWHYYNFNGDPEKSFFLEVCLPIGIIPAEYDGNFHVKRTEVFACVSEIHSGSWLSIPDTYHKMFAFISQNNLKPSGNNREVYINVDFNNPQANQTIIQIGIQRL